MAVVPQGTVATRVNVPNWNTLVNAINANSSGVPANLAEFSDGDATPSVGAGDTDTFRTANTGATSITTFDDGTDGQEIKIIINDANTTFVNGATLKYNSGGDITLAQHDVIKFTLNSTVWCCSGLNLNT